MDIKPYQKAAGYSYDDVMVQPVINALNAGQPGEALSCTTNILEAEAYLVVCRPAALVIITITTIGVHVATCCLCKQHLHKLDQPCDGLSRCSNLRLSR